MKKKKKVGGKRTTHEQGEEKTKDYRERGSISASWKKKTKRQTRSQKRTRRRLTAGHSFRSEKDLITKIWNRVIPKSFDQGGETSRLPPKIHIWTKNSRERPTKRAQGRTRGNRGIPKLRKKVATGGKGGGPVQLVLRPKKKATSRENRAAKDHSRRTTSDTGEQKNRKKRGKENPKKGEKSGKGERAVKH